jgi:NAD(P)-dependent dehydrogenase (short-subunit alcohol dehydrogenase family)
MASSKHVAIITGGASGMGLAVAEALGKHGNWNLHLFDMNEKSGDEAASRLGATFHKVDVTDYTSLSQAFKEAFLANRRIDFVFANAGIMERSNFYKAHNTGDEPPPPMTTIVLDINTNAVVQTSYLAQHYFRQTPHDGTSPRSLVITASCGGLYAVPASPVYGASKFAALGWTRNIAGPMWKNDGESMTYALEE